MGKRGRSNKAWETLARLCGLGACHVLPCAMFLEFCSIKSMLKQLRAKRRLRQEVQQCKIAEFEWVGVPRRRWAFRVMRLPTEFQAALHDNVQRSL